MSGDDQHAVTAPVIYIWCDDSVKTRNTTQATAKNIQNLLNGRFYTYADPDDCVHDITADGVTQRIYFIISNKLGANVVPLIHDLPQIETIYIFCRNQQIAESWSKPFSKVQKIFTKKKSLLDQIRADVHQFTSDDAIAMSAFHVHEKQNSLKNLSPESARFMWYRVAMGVLLLMAKHFDSKKEMIDEARASYHNNNSQKKIIDQFEVLYRPEFALKWYTYDSFVYRLLNRSLRSQKIELIFRFRFFINDLHNQITQLYQQYLGEKKENHLTVYRGQFMSIDEIEFLRKNINGIIAMNTFLSASRSRGIAELFFNPEGSSVDKPSDRSVLFIIHINDINENTTPFAFIERYACNWEEREVLFTMNAVFKVESVKQEGHIWHVHLELSNQQNEQQKELSQYMFDAVGSDPTPSIFGWFLYRMNDFDRAERYVQYIIQQPLDETEKAAAYNLLGLIYSNRKNYKKSIEYYQKAIEIYDDSERFGSPQIIAIHYNLSLAHLADGDHLLAESERQKVDTLLADSCIEKNPLLIAMSKALEGKLAAVQGDNGKALENLEASLKEKRKTLPPNSPTIAGTIHEMGVMYIRMGNETKATACFEEAIKIGEQSLSADHFDLADYHANLGRLRYKRKEYELALEQFERALKITTDATQEDRDVITELLQCIKEITDIIRPSPAEKPKK